VKILLITPEFPPDSGGGIGVYCGDLASELRAQGCEVGVLAGSAFVHGQKSYEFDGRPISVLETHRFDDWFGRFQHFAMFPELRRHLAAAFALHEQANAGEEFDAVEVTDWGMLFLPWIMSSQARVLVQLHGSNGQIAHFEPVVGREAEGAVSLLLEKIALQAAPALSSQSQSNLHWWEALLRRPVGYLPPLLKADAMEAQPYHLNDNWLCVGRIQHWKGPQVACAAWQELGDAAPQLDWVGRDTAHGASGQSTSAWLSRQFPKVWGEKIKPVGRIPADQWQQRMLATKAVLIPSLWDTFNLAAAEAMSRGKVVVVSDGAGAADLVQHGVNGFIFPKGDTAALVKLVKHVESLNQEELNKIGQNAVATIREQLDPTRIAAEKIKLFRSLSEARTNDVSWLRESLMPATGAKPLAFLDGLPLKELTRYVARRGMKKYFGKTHS
jgi:glycosyltransferase involved in cell wall biosynthesis